MINEKEVAPSLPVGCQHGIASGSLDTDKIDQATGLKGKLNEKEGVYKVTFPRDDVKVAVSGWTMPPFMGLGTWAAFKETNAGAMVMGDTVLFEDEVNAVMSTALGSHPQQGAPVDGLASASLWQARG